MCRELKFGRAVVRGEPAERHGNRKRRVRLSLFIARESGVLVKGRVICWPLQDIRSLQGFLALFNHPSIAPFICIAHTIALPFHV